MLQALYNLACLIGAALRYMAGHNGLENELDDSNDVVED